MQVQRNVSAWLALGARVLALALGLAWAGGIHAADPQLPDFAELEAAGAVIGEIRLAVLDIFDTADPREDKALFRLANRLHIQTREGVIRRALLFKSGQKLSVRLIEESERLLRGYRYLYEVRFRPLAVHDGVVDIEVLTRDTWTLDIGGSAGRTGGANTASLSIKEYNLLGSGVSLSVGRFKNVERTGTEFDLADPNLFGSRVALGLSHSTNSDGRRDALSIAQPFYALDSRWAATLSASRDDRIEPVYVSGKVSSQYRHRQTLGELSGGWSAGWVDGWVRRWRAGIRLQDDVYAAEPGLQPPLALPGDGRQVMPFLRVELIEDRIERELNRNLIGRPEFFALGLASTVDLAWAAPGLGSSRGALLYSGSLSKGFEPGPDTTVVAAGRVWGQWVDARVQGQQQSLQAQLYHRQSPRWLFYGGVTMQSILHPAALDTLELGGDNGLRGYPLRYQSGTRRALLTVEERFYTDLYLWRLFRIGGAAYVDYGRAWGGPALNASNPGWLGDVGLGLRIVSARSAFSNVLHVDLAMPLNAASDIRKVQLLVKTRTSF